MNKRAGVVVAVSAAVVIGLGVAPVAHAQMAVIDVAAIKQLVAQINYWKQQIGRDAEGTQPTAADARGVDGSAGNAGVAAAERPAAQLPAEGLGGGGAGARRAERAVRGTRAGGERNACAQRAVLDGGRLAALGDGERESLLEGRRAAAGLAVMTREAYAQAGARFASLAQLVQAIGTATDAKAIADLQGRIAAEQAMLENEQAKLALLAQMAEAEGQAARAADP